MRGLFQPRLRRKSSMAGRMQAWVRSISELLAMDSSVTCGAVLRLKPFHTPVIPSPGLRPPSPGLRPPSPTGRGSKGEGQNGACVSVFVFPLDEPAETAGESVDEFIEGFGIESGERLCFEDQPQSFDGVEVW